ncbi:uncharacterized protein LOC125238722 isoform X2 [Leguminivora glycinivorella]|uniref:uncharacterized protein LOC125238722 isoform X2 n=1 Tax=Leguminivora glycinivorella TaxID=1035111 RepID=UPI00200DBD5B|nr:uncharacterized protein LOC125238722 isoform X2 [Leguminivora glycinivorella]
MLDMIINFVRSTLLEIEYEMNKTDPIRQNNINTPGFEIGFVLRTMEECYRRMIDIYNSTLTTDLYNFDAHTTDLITFLKYVENYYWIINHLENMLHEIEKKHKLKMAGIFENYHEFTIHSPTTKRIRFSSQWVVSMTSRTKRPKQTWWKLDYGWDQMAAWR